MTAHSCGSGVGRTMLLAAFALHNAEEIAYGDFGAGPDPRIFARLGLSVADRRADRMSIATAILAAVLSVATHQRAGWPPGTRTVAVAASGALAANGAGHLLQAAIRRRYNPGLATAPLLLLASLATAREVGAGLSRARVGAAVVAGTALSVPAIVTSLRLARLLRPSHAQLRKEPSA